MQCRRCATKHSMDRMKRWKFFLTAALVPITLLTKLIELRAEAKKKALFDNFVSQGTLTVQFHRLKGKGKKAALSWSPVIHASVESLLTQRANIKSLMKSLARPRIAHSMASNERDAVTKKYLMHLGGCFEGYFTVTLHANPSHTTLTLTRSP